MRESRYTQLFAVAVLSIIFLLSGVVTTNAQRRGQDTRRDDKKSGREWNEQHERRYHHESYDKERWHRNDHRYDKHKKHKKHSKHHSHHGHSHHYGHKKQYHGYYHSCRHHGSYHKPRPYHHGPVHHKHSGHYHHHRVYHVNHHECYDHHDHGRVVVRFGVDPVVIRHHHGDYFFVDGCYYQYRPHIGYVVVKAPRRVYFDTLPYGCRTVHHRGVDYYVNGDLYFERCTQGFRLVAQPSSLNISVRF